MREYLKQQQNEYLAIKGICEVIEDGIAFYDNLYKQLVQQYLKNAEISTTLLPDDGASSIQQQQRSQHKLDFIAKVTAQKLLICLGDLWRYKIKDTQGQDYTEAEKFYQHAQAWVPSNGVPYNQLAIIAILNRKKFCAIYFHMRSLMSSNVIYSSKESLLVLFDEVRKKYEETELKSSPVHSFHTHHQSRAVRKEVWVYPDGMRRLHRTNFNSGNSYKIAVCEEKRFMDMPAEELQRRVTSLYLYIIGKLFTGVGMETVVEHQRKFLLQLSVLLMNDKLPITRTRLLQILALNIFVIEINLKKDTRRYHAFNFNNQFLGLILRKANKLLAESDNNPEEFKDENFSDLSTLLQYIRIYILWLKHNSNVWEPTRNEDHIHLNTWPELEKLLNRLKHKDFTAISCDNIQFEEDIFMAGFTPLATIIPRIKTHFISEESLQHNARLKVISEFQGCYDENRYRLENVEASQNFVTEDLNLDIKQALDELQSSQPEAGDMKIDKTNDKVSEDDGNHLEDEEVGLENIVDDGESIASSTSTTSSTLNHNNNTIELNSQLTHLSKLKKELEAKSNVKKMYSEKLEDILKIVDTKVYIEVRPRYLLPDTNCFIDCLDDFERIISKFKRFTLVVPLTVVKELDGLSKGFKVEVYQESLQKHRIHHYDDVSTKAKKSLEFIKNAKSHVKCATTKGSMINASMFALMEEENVSNDDKILATALALSKTMSSETSKDGKCFIQTELVLITTDRNLRVKSLSRNLAVSELSEFLQWAEDCSN